jgi:hypothetical protein
MAILADKSGLLGLKVALATNEHPHGVSSYFEVLIPVALVSFANLVMLLSIVRWPQSFPILILLEDDDRSVFFFS